MAHESDAIVGMAVFAKGECVLRLGIAKLAVADALLRNKSWLRETRERRLSVAQIKDVDYAVLSVAITGADVLVFSQGTGAAVLEFFSNVEFAHEIIHHLLTDPFDAMTVVDSQGQIAYLAPVHEEFFGLAPGEALGRPVSDVIENTRLDHVVRSGKAEVGFLQKMRGVERVVTRVPIRRGDRILGAIGRVMFRGPEQVEEMSRRIRSLENDLEFYRREAAALRSGNSLEIVGESPAIKKLRAQIERVASLETPIFIRGESGTGKELVAHALDLMSPRRDAAMVTVNAARIPGPFVESELFGYEPGAFPGADQKGRKGKFEQANGGTILVDEIGDMPVDVQPKLMRVLQDRFVERIGSDQAHEVDFRLIVSSNRDLQSLIETGQFRLDLYHRISAIVIDVPPLRERLVDIPLLAQHFLKEIAYRHARPEPMLSDDALAFLMEQAWPGNVRQLRNELENAFAFAEAGIIRPENFSQYQQQNGPLGAHVAAPGATTSDATSLRNAVNQVEERRIRIALEKFAGNKKKVASELGISRSYLYKKLAMMHAAGELQA